jgi:hypothetical protein
LFNILTIEKKKKIEESFKVILMTSKVIFI